MPKEIARAATDVSDEETMSAIRAMMTESATPPKQVPSAARKPQHAAPKPRVARSDVPEPSTPVPERLSQRKRLSSPRLDLLGRIRRIRYRPSRRLVFWCVLALLVFLKPHVFVIGALLTVFVIGAVFALCGSEAVWGFGMRVFERYGQSEPARAAWLAGRLDAFAMRWDGFLDRFPEGAVDGLYLPDFQSLKEADARHAEIMDERLARLRSDAQEAA